MRVTLASTSQHRGSWMVSLHGHWGNVSHRVWRGFVWPEPGCGSDLLWFTGVCAQVLLHTAGCDVIFPTCRCALDADAFAKHSLAHVMKDQLEQGGPRERYLAGGSGWELAGVFLKWRTRGKQDESGHLRDYW